MLDVDRDYSQFGEQRIVLDFFSGLSGRFNPYCVDAGAFDGVYFSNSRALFMNGWRGILIEPNPRVFPKLRALYEQNENITCLQTALSRSQTDSVQMKFGIGPVGISEESKWWFGLVSTLHDSMAEMVEKRQSIRFEQQTVSADTLSAVLRKAGAPKDIGFLTIDCEGEDRHIIKTLDFQSFRPTLIAVEADANDLPHYENMLVPEGYVLHACTKSNAFFRLSSSQK